MASTKKLTERRTRVRLDALLRLELVATRHATAFRRALLPIAILVCGADSE